MNNLLGNFGDQETLVHFSCEIVRHEIKNRVFTAALLRLDSNASAARGNQIPLLDLTDLLGSGTAAIPDNDRVHLLVGDGEPLTFHFDKSIEIGRGIKIIGEKAVTLRFNKAAILPIN